MSEAPQHLAFGALAPTLAQQLGVSKIATAVWQKDADAITRLAIRGMLTDGETRAARLRLVKELRSAFGALLCAKCGGSGVVADMARIERTGDPHANRSCRACRGSGRSLLKGIKV